MARRTFFRRLLAQRWGSNAILLALGIVLLCVAAGLFLGNSRFAYIFFVSGSIFTSSNLLFLICYWIYWNRRTKRERERESQL